MKVKALAAVEAMAESLDNQTALTLMLPAIEQARSGTPGLRSRPLRRRRGALRVKGMEGLSFL